MIYIRICFRGALCSADPILKMNLYEDEDEDEDENEDEDDSVISTVPEKRKARA